MADHDINPDAIRERVRLLDDARAGLSALNRSANWALDLTPEPAPAVYSALALVRAWSASTLDRALVEQEDLIARFHADAEHAS